MGKRKGSNSTAIGNTAARLAVHSRHGGTFPGIGNAMARMIRSSGLVLVTSFFVLFSGAFVGQGSLAFGAPEKAADDAKKAEKPARAIAWGKIPPAERSILAPLEPEWDKLPGVQQRKLLGTAREYPKLAPLEQERFRERLRGWSSLTPDQRKSARDKYQSLTKLPPDKQQEIKDRWNQEKGSGAASSPAPVAPPPTVPK